MPEEKGEEEGIEKKFRRAPFVAIFLALIAILAGIFFFLATRGHIEWGDWLGYFLLCLGLVFIIKTHAVKLVLRTHR